MLSGVVLMLAYAVGPGALPASTITMTVQSSSAEGTWSCILDLFITAEVTRDPARKHADKVTVTIHAPHARMEAAASSPASFQKTIAAESPSQQQAIALLDGKSLSFEVDRATGALLGGAARTARFPADVSFAGVDAGYWFAFLWVTGTATGGPKEPPAGAPRPLHATHATDWGVPWKLAGEVTVTPASYLASAGALEGDLTVGRAAAAIKRHVKLTIAPRR